jgi:NADPH-dependent 2,4-dienoyl-CoA reductase/sulfur reductase-like enzyme
MTALSRIVVVGAGIAGVRAVEALRAEGYDGNLTVIDADSELPYDRPPLSKEFLTGVLDEEDLRVWSLDHVAELDVDLRLATMAVGLDTARKRLSVRSDDEGVDELEYDRLVLAFGVTARRPLDVTDLDGVYVLRSLADARGLRDRLRSAPGPVVVIGGGFIGGEVASSVRECGLDVTIIEAGDHLLPNALTADVVRPLERLHEQRGVRFVYGKQVTGVKGVDTVECVELSDGTRLPAAVVVEGLGCVPETSWLQRTGMTLANGIEVDAQLRTSADDVYAIGDVARWRDTRTGAFGRLEHWENARKQGTHVALSLLGAAIPFEEVPYVWTDQSGGKLQIAGAAQGDELRFLRGDPDDSEYVAIVRRGDFLAGVIAFGPIGPSREFKQLRRTLMTHATWESVISSDLGTRSPHTAT